MSPWKDNKANGFNFLPEGSYNGTNKVMTTEVFDRPNAADF